MPVVSTGPFPIPDTSFRAMIPGRRDDLMMARAACRVVVTAEEITEKELTMGDGVNDTFLPAIDVDVVVHLPWGAHPCACGLL